MWLNLYGREAVQHKLKNRQKMLIKMTKGFHMRYHFFLYYGWFLQKLRKDFIRTNMHTTVHQFSCGILKMVGPKKQDLGPWPSFFHVDSLSRHLKFLGRVYLNVIYWRETYSTRQTQENVSTSPIFNIIFWEFVEILHGFFLVFQASTGKKKEKITGPGNLMLNIPLMTFLEVDSNPVKNLTVRKQYHLEPTT